MNKRIKELAEQAGIVLWQSHLGSITHYEGKTESLEKFAELIIKECAKVCYRTGVLEQDEKTGWMYGDAIQEHFGVE